MTDAQILMLAGLVFGLTSALMWNLTGFIQRRWGAYQEAKAMWGDEDVDYDIEEEDK